MQRLFTVIFLFCLLTKPAFAAQEAEKSAKVEGDKKIGNVTVFAENNMAYPLVKLTRIYSKDAKSAVSIDFNYSFELIENIDAGEPADVFISSHPEWIKTLKNKGLVDVYNVVNLAKDKLLLVTSKNNRKIEIEKINKSADINSILKQINKQNIPLIVDSEYTSLGLYTEDIIKKAKVRNQKIFRKFSEDKKSIIDFINENDEYCGIVLASSVKYEDEIMVLKEIADEEINYQALVIAGDNMNQARDFLKFAQSAKAKKVLMQSGFTVK